MNNPSRTLALFRLTFPFVVVLTLNIPFARAASTEATMPVATPPVIRTLIATPSKITAGSEVRLRWAAPGAMLFSITTDNGANLGQVSGNSLVVHPTTTTTYTIIALNAAGESVKSITVPVVAALPSMPLGAFAGTASPALMQHRH